MSFQQALSGLNGTAKNLDVIGNNIANAGTFGAKASRAEFSDMYAAAVGSANSIGIGVALGTVAQQFSQGSIKATENTLDTAIKGAGFFQLADTSGNIVYSRNGQFKVDRDGYLVNNQKMRLIAYGANEQGVILAPVAGPLQLPTGNVSPKSTSTSMIEANLDSRHKTLGSVVAPTIDFADANTFNNATSMTVYDEQGQQVSLTFYFQKAEADKWNVFASANGTDAVGAPGTPVPLTTLEFPSNGVSPTVPAGPVSINVPATPNANGSATLPFTMTVDFSALSQYGSGFGVTKQGQNGFSAGVLNSVVVEADGIVLARYSNGQSRPAGQIELANFRNPQGLSPVGDNSWARTFASGDPLTSQPGNGAFGLLQSSALEESNVDLTGELVNMIVAQRMYQANAQTIKTQDQVLQTLVNLR